MNLFFDSMKFLFSVIAAYVGIRAVINSSKSAKLSSESVRISSESIQITKDKELREQSSHLIVTSIIDNFPFNVPMYKKRIPDLLPNESEGITEIREKFPEGGFEQSVVEFISKIRLEYVTEILENRYISGVDLHTIDIVNNGKGSSVNIKYEFTFENISDFVDYQTPSPKEDISITSMFPNYQMQVLETNESYKISISDNRLLKYLDPTNLGKQAVSYYSKKDYYYYKNQENIEYKSYLNPSEEMKVFLPNEFMILCKHYAIQYYFRKNIDLISPLKSTIIPHVFNNPLIKPIGKITISFYDESLIRTGKYTPEQRTVLEYEVALKDEAIKKIEGDAIRFYLEVNLSKSETNFNAKRETI